jgi:uncharacterized membrane protein
VGGATAGSGGDAGTAGAGGAGDAGEGGDAGAAGDAERATFHWIEATEEHRERAASSPEPAFLRTLVFASGDASVLIGTSDLIIGMYTDELYTDGMVWTEATGTTALGGLPGVVPRPFNVLSAPRASSADGSVVVGSAQNVDFFGTAFRWTRADGMEVIAEDGGAEGVSADGSVVVGVHPEGVFRWTRELGAVTIVEPLAGGEEVSVLAVSPDGGAVLGQSFREDAVDASGRLFLWTEDTGTRVVENLPGGIVCRAELATFSRSRGLVAGGVCFDETGYEPFLWAGEDRLTPLGPTDALGGYEPFQPVAVSADGSVAVGVASNGVNESRVYRWTETNGLELIELPLGYTSSSPTYHQSMSEDGSVVVGRMEGTARHSFLWSEGAGAVVLSPLEGHDSSEVSVVSTDGSVAAGTSRLGTSDSTAVYWRADGVAHRIADELAAAGVDLVGGALRRVWSVKAPLEFFGNGSKDEVSTELCWHARLP